MATSPVTAPAAEPPGRRRQLIAQPRRQTSRMKQQQAERRRHRHAAGRLRPAAAGNRCGPRRRTRRDRAAGRTAPRRGRCSGRCPSTRNADATADSIGPGAAPVVELGPVGLREALHDRVGAHPRDGRAATTTSDMTIAARRERPANPRDDQPAPVRTSESASAEMPERDIVITSDSAITRARGGEQDQRGSPRATTATGFGERQPGPHAAHACCEAGAEQRRASAAAPSASSRRSGSC